MKIHSIGPIAESYSTVPIDHYLLVWCSDYFPCVHPTALALWDDRYGPTCSIMYSSKLSLQGLIGPFPLDLGSIEAARRSKYLGSPGQGGRGRPQGLHLDRFRLKQNRGCYALRTFIMDILEPVKRISYSVFNSRRRSGIHAVPMYPGMI